jgi:hypothetical protein
MGVSSAIIKLDEEKEEINILRTVEGIGEANVGDSLFAVASYKYFLSELGIEVNQGIFRNAMLGLSRDGEGNLVGIGFPVVLKREDSLTPKLE